MGYLDDVIQRASKIKLSGGLVGRVCTLLVVACITLGVIGASSKNDLISGGAIVAIVLLLFPMLWRIITFAEENPGVALLDGAQLLKHEQLRLASKNESNIEVVANLQREDRAVMVPPEIAAMADLPDTPLVTNESPKREQ